MLKKLAVLTSILMIIILFSSCSPDNNILDKKYDVTLKAINSNDNIIENAVITVSGEGSGEGVFNIELTKGSYTVSVEDPSGYYLKTEKQIVVDRDEIITLHMFRNSKSVSIKPLIENNNLLDRAEVSIEGVEGIKENGIYDFELDIGKEYTVKITDPQGYYETTEKTFTVEEDTDNIEVILDKAPTGTVKGNLYLSEEYNNAKIIYGKIKYFDKEITSTEDGFEIELPEGKREITVDTVFGGTTTKQINVQSGTLNKVDITVPLPEDFPFEKWTEGYLGDPMVRNDDLVIRRWKKNTIKYYIGFTEYVENNHHEDWKKRYKENIRKGVNAIDYFMEDLVNYEEVDNLEQADVEFLVVNDADWKGLLDEQEIVDNEIIFSRIKLKSDHLYKLDSGPVYPAHELGHSLAFGHSPDTDDLMYFNPYVDLDTWKEELNDEKMIFGLVYSLEFGTKNIITD